MSVSLKSLWLNDVAVPSDARSFPLMGQLDWSPARPAAITAMADGSLTAEVDPTMQQVAAMQIAAVSPADVTWLLGHAGRTVWVRDDIGTRLAAVYEPPAVSRHQYDENAEVSFTLRQVTVREGA